MTSTPTSDAPPNWLYLRWTNDSTLTVRQKMIGTGWLCGPACLAVAVLKPWQPDRLAVLPWIQDCEADQAAMVEPVQGEGQWAGADMARRVDRSRPRR